MCKHVFACMWPHTCMCEYMCRPKVNCGVSSLGTLTPYSLRQDLSRAPWCDWSCLASLLGDLPSLPSKAGIADRLPGSSGIHLGFCGFTLWIPVLKRCSKCFKCWVIFPGPLYCSYGHMYQPPHRVLSAAEALHTDDVSPFFSHTIAMAKWLLLSSLTIVSPVKKFIKTRDPMRSPNHWTYPILLLPLTSHSHPCTCFFF